MANVCFGCHEVGDIKKCPKKDCVHYSYRNEHLKMDTVKNDELDKMVKRNFRYTIGA